MDKPLLTARATDKSLMRARTDKHAASTYLMYHDVFLDRPSASLARTATLYHVSKQKFAEHLLTISRSGYPVVTVGEALAKPSCASVVLTFDDGWAGTFHYALPLLEQLGWRATIFITRDFVDQPGFCTRAMVLAAARAGAEIGVHGTTHRMLSECSDAEIEWEFGACKSYLESLLRQPVEIASLPGGGVNSRVISGAAAAGIKALCTSRPGTNSEATPVLQLRRMAIRGMTSTADIRRYCRHQVNREIARWVLTASLARFMGTSRYAAVRRRLLNK